MAMSKKDFIALADAIKQHNRDAVYSFAPPFQDAHLQTLADFCKSQNSAFMRERWLGYIVGENGPNSGTPRK